MKSFGLFPPRPIPSKGVAFLVSNVPVQVDGGRPVQRQGLSLPRRQGVRQRRPPDPDVVLPRTGVDVPAVAVVVAALGPRPLCADRAGPRAGVALARRTEVAHVVKPRRLPWPCLRARIGPFWICPFRLCPLRLQPTGISPLGAG